jgi:hypothetical protein
MGVDDVYIQTLKDPSGFSTIDIGWIGVTYITKSPVHFKKPSNT